MQKEDLNWVICASKVPYRVNSIIIIGRRLLTKQGLLRRINIIIIIINFPQNQNKANYASSTLFVLKSTWFPLSSRDLLTFKLIFNRWGCYILTCSYLYAFGRIIIKIPE